MENNVKNREAFFGEIEPCGNGYSVIDGKKVHIDRITEIEAEGTTDSGDWFAAKKDFGILKCNLTTALADDDIAAEELTIPEERRISKFLESHEKDELYTIEHFSSWYRRMTGACMTGRNNFICENKLNPEDKCSVKYFLKLVHEKKVSNSSLEYLLEQYADAEEKLQRKGEMDETTNFDTTV